MKTVGVSKNKNLLRTLWQTATIATVFCASLLFSASCHAKCEPCGAGVCEVAAAEVVAWVEVLEVGEDGYLGVSVKDVFFGSAFAVGDVVSVARNYSLGTWNSRVRVGMVSVIGVADVSESQDGTDFAVVAARESDAQGAVQTTCTPATELSVEQVADAMSLESYLDCERRLSELGAKHTTCNDTPFCGAAGATSSGLWMILLALLGLSAFRQRRTRA